MADVHTEEQRRYNMRRISGKDTKPEMLVRRGLHARGLRFRLHCRHLPGKPDIVLARHSTIILVHGCFWHGHDCPLFKWPATRMEFWKDKINKNRERDTIQLNQLKNLGWRILIIWECALKGKNKCNFQALLDSTEVFVRHSRKLFLELECEKIT